MSSIFHRPDLAARLTGWLTQPVPPGGVPRSPLFISGARQTGKTTFLRADLIPALQAQGAEVIYVDLSGCIGVRSAKQMQTTLSRAVLAYGIASSGIRGFHAAGGSAFADALRELIAQVRADVVLVIDDVQHALASESGATFLLALLAARDALVKYSSAPGRLLFIGTGAHLETVHAPAARRSPVFVNSATIPFPVLGIDYVDHLLGCQRAGGHAALSRGVAADAFAALGSRPADMLHALGVLHSVGWRGRDDERLPVIADTLRSATAYAELAKLGQLGELAVTLFERIAASNGDTCGLYSHNAVTQYAETLGREIRADEIRRGIGELTCAYLILRSGHGRYRVFDPDVQQVWRSRRLIDDILSVPATGGLSR